ncbi:MAG TPA: sugar phosphate isomerase/epimerase [Actinomycetes bacterium]|jgi:inosose dehydratase|nr:sugar phosphate isomerase/epimerase [Actinomycetes bacterium]
MTDAAVPAGTTRSRLRLGSCPDSWGVWFADDPAQTPWPRFLDELAQAGYGWLELGPYGYLPTDPGRLREEVDRRGLRVSGQAVFGALHDAAGWEDDLRDARQVAELVTAVGAGHVVLLPAGFRDLDGTWLGSRELDEPGWRTLCERTSELGRVLAGEYGVAAVFHPHADSYVGTQAQIERFLDETDPAAVNLCLDTGHVAYYRGDNLELIRRYPDRIGYLHLKQADPAVVAQVEAEDLWFAEAVRRGVMCELPKGEPDTEALLEAVDRHLEGALFAIVEQDLYPCDPDEPLPIAARTCAYLRQLGVGSEAR